MAAAEPTQQLRAPAVARVDQRRVEERRVFKLSQPLGYGVAEGGHTRVMIGAVADEYLRHSNPPASAQQTARRAACPSDGRQEWAGANVINAVGSLQAVDG